MRARVNYTTVLYVQVRVVMATASVAVMTLSAGYDITLFHT